LFVTLPFPCPIETVEAFSASYATLESGLYLQNIEMPDWKDDDDDAFLFPHERLWCLLHRIRILPVLTSA
jgi:hypothetical protein